MVSLLATVCASFMLSRVMNLGAFLAKFSELLIPHSFFTTYSETIPEANGGAHSIAWKIPEENSDVKCSGH